MDATCEEICMGAGVDVICIYINTRISTYAIYTLMQAAKIVSVNDRQ
jgi:hypothetical protein